MTHHPDHPSVKDFQLECQDSLSAAALIGNELKLNRLKESENSSLTESERTIEASTTPVCAVKPLPQASRLGEDLADTFSAIEALCSLNNENNPLSVHHDVPPSSGFQKQHNNHLSNVTLIDPNIDENTVLENTLNLQAESQVMLTILVKIKRYLYRIIYIPVQLRHLVVINIHKTFAV